MSGPYWEYDKGSIRNYWIAPGIRLIQEPGDSNWSVVGKAEMNAQFRNDWGFDFNIGLGRYYEADTNYLYRYINLSTWGILFGNRINFGCDYSYSYNYYRGFLAYQGNNWFSYIYSIIPQMSVGLASNFWIEWDTDNSILAIWPMLRPSIRIKINADMGIDIFNEIVMQTPRTNFSEIDLLSNRFGFLFSWNFMPKSWLYIALNDHRMQGEGGNLQPLYQIGAIKAKYLIYF
jgi:hypothetical protein